MQKDNFAFESFFSKKIMQIFSRMLMVLNTNIHTRIIDQMIRA